MLINLASPVDSARCAMPRKNANTEFSQLEEGVGLQATGFRR
jgi:hypothetical protein